MVNKLLIITIFIFLLSGCAGFFGFWMNGDPSGGRNITPMRDYWVLPGGTAEEKAQQWAECGGDKDGGYHISPPGLTREEIKKAGDEKFYQLQICMMKMGYQYMGSCKGEIPSAYPACRRKN